MCIEGVYNVGVQVFMKSVKLEWCLGDIRKANELLVESVKHYPNFAKVSYHYCY